MIGYKVDFGSLPWDEPIPGVRHKIVNQGGVRLRLVEYSKSMEPHWCNRGHVGMILDGRFEIRYDAGTEIYEPGDGVMIPTGEEHRHMATALTDTVKAVFIEEA